MKVTIASHVFMEATWTADFTRQTWAPTTWPCRLDDNADRVYLGTQQVVVEVPDDFDPTAQQIAAIEREKKAAADLFRKTIAACNERLSKLQALEAA